MYKNLFHDKKGVFFDLDGTVIDSLPYWKDSFVIILEELDYLEELRDNFIDKGHYVTEIWRYIKKQPNVDIELSIKDLTEKTYKTYLKLFEEGVLEPRDGFWSFIRELREKGYKLALVSNTDMKVVDPVISKLNIKEGIFDLIITGDMVRKRKPHPAIYKKTLRKLKLKPHQVLVFEDSVTGSTSAKRAGLDVVAIWNGQENEREYPENVKTFLPDFSSFPGNLEKTYLEHARKGITDIELQKP